MICVPPTETPVTMPVAEFTVANAGSRLNHVPPVSPFVLKGIIEPTQTEDGSLELMRVLLIVPGFATGFTVIV
jgi:hypothetical protein